MTKPTTILGWQGPPGVDVPDVLHNAAVRYALTGSAEAKRTLEEAGFTPGPRLENWRAAGRKVMAEP